jgi:hypothetical protein
MSQSSRTGRLRQRQAPTVPRLSQSAMRSPLSTPHEQHTKATPVVSPLQISNPSVLFPDWEINTANHVSAENYPLR